MLERLAKVLPFEAQTLKLHIKKYEEMSKEKDQQDQWSSVLVPLQREYDQHRARLADLVPKAVALQESLALKVAARVANSIPAVETSSSLPFPSSSLPRSCGNRVSLRFISYLSQCRRARRF